MKIEHIINETTTAGAVSSVAMPLGKTQRRTTENVKGLIPAEKVLKAKKKGPYANSLSEGKDKKPVIEADLQEDDLIIIPGQSKRLKAGFIPKAQDRTDHEIEMARADLLALYKNTKTVFDCLKNRSEDEGLEGWVQEKIIKASDYMNTLAEYFEGKKIQEMTGGVIAAGGVGEGVAEAGFMNPSNPLSPLNPVSPLNPGSPIYVGKHAGYATGGGTISPGDAAILFDILKSLLVAGITGTAAAVFKVKLDDLYDAAKDKAKLDVKELFDIQKEISRLQRALDKTTNPKTKEKYEKLLADAGNALEEIKARSEMKSKGQVDEQGVAEGANSELSNYIKLLHDHDWYHSYGDDAEAQQGYDERQVLLKLAKKLDPTFKIWNKIAPNGFKQFQRKSDPEKAYPDYGLDEQGVAEGFSDVVKGIKRSIKGKEHPDVVASIHAGRAIGHYNQGNIAAGDKETKRYEKTRNMHLKAKGVAEGYGDDRGDYHATAKAANQASRTAKSKQDHAKAADLHSRAATYGLSAGQDQSVIHDHQMTAREHNRASKGLKEQDVTETQVSKHRDLGATSDTTYFIKNIKTGKVVSPHRSLQDAKDALVAYGRDGKGDDYKIVRARNEGVAEGTLTEKAKSTAQQKFFGMAHAMQKGKKIPGASKELKDVAKSMSKSDVKDFAKTKHKDLPSHVKKEK